MMINRSFPSPLWQRLLHTFVLLTFVFSPLQSIAAYGPPPARPEPVGRVANSSYDALPSGLFRTTVTLRHPSDWERLEKMGVVVLRTAGGITADHQEAADQEGAQSAASWQSAVILADAAQLEALARLRFEPRGTDELYQTSREGTSPRGQRGRQAGQATPVAGV